MNTLRFVTTCLVTLALFTLCAALAPQTIVMLGSYSGSELGPGILPATCLLGITGCMVYVFFAELRLFRSSRGHEGKDEEKDEDLSSFGLPLREFMLRSIAGIILLWAYVLLWHLTSFLPATFLFCLAFSFLAQNKKGWNKKELIQASLSLALFTIGAWWIFARLLMVPLR